MGVNEIIEKSAIIQENEPKVFNAGKLNTLKKSKYMHPTVSGEIVSMSDVNTLSHKLSVNLTSDDITDFSDIKISRYGKNLFDLEKARDINNWVKINNSYRYFPIAVKKGVPLSASFSYKETITGSNYINIGSSYNLGGVQGNWYASLLNVSTQGNQKTFTPTEDTIYIIANVTWDSTISAATMGNFITNVGIDLQIEVGSASTDYEAYIEPQTVVSSADGIVEGITALSPNMTLISDKEGAIINCKYFRDIDRYIDNLMIDVAASGGE